MSMRHIGHAGALGVLLFAALAASGCGSEDKPVFAGASTSEGGGSGELSCADAPEVTEIADEVAPEAECPDGRKQVICFGNWAATCEEDGERTDLVNCRLDDEVCVSGACNGDDCQGCFKCAPGQVRCGTDGQRTRCNDDGTGFDDLEGCDVGAGDRCNPGTGACEDLCAVAEDERSYIGCDYWAVETSSAELEFMETDADGVCQPFPFSIVIGNSYPFAANVRVESPGHAPKNVAVAPLATETVQLPCTPSLNGNVEGAATAFVRNAAHHVRSDVPVTVYQYNPLEFQSGEEFTYTNDSSLLLPTHALTGNYVAMSAPTMWSEIEFRNEEDEETWGQDPGTPGFLSIVGVEDGETLVEITSSAYTKESLSGNVPALEPGDKLEVRLRAGDVLQLVTQTPDDCDGESEESTPVGPLTYCKVSQDYDLTGTKIRAQGKVAVVSGHDCTFLPYNRWACDHLEESMFPVESWGTEVVLSMTQGIACQPGVPNLARVYSNTDRNSVHFVPEVHEPVVLDAGDYVQFEFEESFVATGTAAIMVAQYLQGQDYEGRGSAGRRGRGDPALSLGIPLQQWRTHYAFLVPETFPLNYANVVAQPGQLLLLDGRVVSGLVPIEGTRYATSRIALDGGQHVLESGEPFGLVLYGYAPYASYMNPGGLDLNLINAPD